MIGIPPPDDMPRSEWACWYWAEIQRTAGGVECDVDSPHLAEECDVVQDLITGAIEAGVTGHLVPVEGFARPQALSSLLAPYRTVPGGLTEVNDAAKATRLNTPYGGPMWSEGW